MIFSILRLFFTLLVSLSLLLTSCAPTTPPSSDILMPDASSIDDDIPPGFATVDGSRPLTFPADFGAHEDYRTEWWYYTGNLQTKEGQHFGFELTIFRVGLLSPTVELPSDSKWYNRNLYFAHFAVSDIGSDRFYAFERYSRPGPGLAGAEGSPYHVWLEDWGITEQEPGIYRLQAEQEAISLDLMLTDDMGVILHGEGGYSRKGKDVTDASYYYSQPRLPANGVVQVDGTSYAVDGLAWMDHEFSSSVLDKDQIGWDWFSLQFEDGQALMLFQLREWDGKISTSSSGTFISEQGFTQVISNAEYKITVLDEWRSPHTQGLYPARWEIQINEPDCLLKVQPWMADQEINFPAVTYWEGAVHFDGTCKGDSVHGNGYIELTGYTGNLPLQ